MQSMCIVIQQYQQDAVMVPICIFKRRHLKMNSDHSSSYLCSVPSIKTSNEEDQSTSIAKKFFKDALFKELGYLVDDFGSN